MHHQCISFYSLKTPGNQTVFTEGNCSQKKFPIQWEWRFDEKIGEILDVGDMTVDIDMGWRWWVGLMRDWWWRDKRKKENGGGSVFRKVRKQMFDDWCKWILVCIISEAICCHPMPTFIIIINSIISIFCILYFYINILY